MEKDAAMKFDRYGTLPPGTLPAMLLFLLLALIATLVMNPYALPLMIVWLCFLSVFMALAWRVSVRLQARFDGGSARDRIEITPDTITLYAADQTVTIRSPDVFSYKSVYFGRGMRKAVIRDCFGHSVSFCTSKRLDQRIMEICPELKYHYQK